jgi:hypothetical protein
VEVLERPREFAIWRLQFRNYIGLMSSKGSEDGKEEGEREHE